MVYACLRRSEVKRAGRFSDAFRFLWVILSKFWDGWERVCHAMKPRTVVDWQQKVFQLFWKRKSRGEAGRKPIALALRKMIRRISQENPLWGAAKIPIIVNEYCPMRTQFNSARDRRYLVHFLLGQSPVNRLKFVVLILAHVLSGSASEIAILDPKGKTWALPE
jgi:hypothetical protein